MEESNENGLSKNLIETKVSEQVKFKTKIARFFKKLFTSELIEEIDPNEEKKVEIEITDEEIEEFKQKKLKELRNFDVIGYQRALGGYFYQFFFAILGGVVIFVLFGSILAVVYPYPTAKGYVNSSMIMFSFIQFIFNIPTAFAIERFVSEWRIKNPHKMLEYIRFYIWYQMITGLILVTSLSWFILYILDADSGLEYAKWLMLILLTREYPAMLDIFFACIKGLQQFDLESQIYFSRDIITKGFEIGFVVLGRIWGESNPRIGGLMGLAIGYAIGTYLDDFINMLIAALYFRKVLKKMGFKLSDTLIPYISKDVIKTSFIYGFQISWPGIFSTITGFFVFFAWYEAVPAYLTLQTLNATADELANITKRSEGINLKGGLSESFNNKRPALTQYYIAQIFKWYGFFTTGIGIIVLTFFPALMEVIFSGHDLETYLLAIPFILPNVLHTILVEGLEGSSKQILDMTNLQWIRSLLDIGHNIATLITTYIYLEVTHIPQKYGIAAMIWIMPMGNFIADFGFMLIRWIIINKKVVKLNIPIWQSFIAPLPPAIITFIIGKLWVLFIHPIIIESLGLYIGGVITLLFAFIGCFLFTFITLYSYFGGWDDYGLNVFYEAVKISGPSRIFFVPIAKMSGLLTKISPLHNKFPIPYEKAERARFELMIIRERNDEMLKNKE
ncbi:MAG: hypothetical protein ACTSRZ_03430 [Promethearchaeota archaeon]